VHQVGKNDYYYYYVLVVLTWWQNACPHLSPKAQHVYNISKVRINLQTWFTFCHIITFCWSFINNWNSAGDV